jgi:hypothetical protein
MGTASQGWPDEGAWHAPPGVAALGTRDWWREASCGQALGRARRLTGACQTPSQPSWQPPYPSALAGPKCAPRCSPKYVQGYPCGRLQGGACPRVGQGSACRFQGACPRCWTEDDSEARSENGAAGPCEGKGVVKQSGVHLERKQRVPANPRFKPGVPAARQGTTLPSRGDYPRALSAHLDCAKGA